MHILQLWEIITICNYVIYLVCLHNYQYTCTDKQNSTHLSRCSHQHWGSVPLYSYRYTSPPPILWYDTPLYIGTSWTSAGSPHNRQMYYLREDFNNISFCFHIRNNLSQNYLNPPPWCSTQYSVLILFFLFS